MTAALFLAIILAVIVGLVLGVVAGAWATAARVYAIARDLRASLPVDAHEARAAIGDLITRMETRGR